MKSRVFVASRGALRPAMVLLLPLLISPSSARAQAPPKYNLEELAELTSRCETAHGRGFWNEIQFGGLPADERVKKCSNTLGAYRCVALLMDRAHPGTTSRLEMLRNRFVTQLAQNDCSKYTPSFVYSALPTQLGDIKESGGIRHRAARDLGPPRTRCEQMYPGPPTAFWDPFELSCFTCPVGFGRTIVPGVTLSSACEKGGPFGQHTAGTKMGTPTGCPKGAWHLKRGSGKESCYTCDAGFERFDGFPNPPKDVYDIYPYITLNPLRPAECQPTAGFRERRKTTATPRPRGE